MSKIVVSGSKLNIFSFEPVEFTQPPKKSL